MRLDHQLLFPVHAHGVQPYALAGMSLGLAIIYEFYLASLLFLPQTVCCIEV